VGRLLTPLIFVVVLLPIAVGLAGTALPAFGWLPAIGGEVLSLAAWRSLLDHPGIVTSLRLTLTIGLLATVVSLVIATAICAIMHDRPSFARLQRLLTPILAAPHAAIAIGFAFLIAPSGWLVRLTVPVLASADRPPDIVTLQDPLGLAAAAGLLLKEVPFLVMMMVAATTQVNARQSLMAARSMGYGRLGAWLKVVFPLIYRQIRLPLYAVLAFSLSSVEIALVLAPGAPPPLSVVAARWFADYDLQLYFVASAAAMLQLVLVLAAIGAWRLLEAAVAAIGRRWLASGWRRDAAEPVLAVAGSLAIAVGVLAAASLTALLVWSFAEAWRYPAPLPPQWTLATWQAQADRAASVSAVTALIGALSALIALVLAVACLEAEDRSARRTPAAWQRLVYGPLIVPQIAFLFGVQLVLVRTDLDGSIAATIWVHLLFVFPYVFLSLADAWRALDPRYARIGAALGASRVGVLLRIKLPMLLRPLLTALAIGFAVSLGQYLSTLFAGAGRIATLTTEAVTLASGGDRRVLGVFAFLAALMPLVGFLLALAVPAIIWRHRRGLA
jgi:putative thiamine transport system permease protein